MTSLSPSMAEAGSKLSDKLWFAGISQTNDCGPKADDAISTRSRPQKRMKEDVGKENSTDKT
jgi:hypothetical protein